MMQTVASKHHSLKLHILTKIAAWIRISLTFNLPC